MVEISIQLQYSKFIIVKGLMGGGGGGGGGGGDRGRDGFQSTDNRFAPFLEI